jgi:hypothetical protein
MVPPHKREGIRNWTWKPLSKVDLIMVPARPSPNETVKIHETCTFVTLRVRSKMPGLEMYIIIYSFNLYSCTYHTTTHVTCTHMTLVSRPYYAVL